MVLSVAAESGKVEEWLVPVRCRSWTGTRSLSLYDASAPTNTLSDPM